MQNNQSVKQIAPEAAFFNLFIKVFVGSRYDPYIDGKIFITA